MNGFISFCVDREGLQVLRAWGLLTQMKQIAPGRFDIDLESAVDHYQVSVANDGPEPIEVAILERHRDNFLVDLKRRGEPYNPDIRCTVSVDAVPE